MCLHGETLTPRCWRLFKPANHLVADITMIHAVQFLWVHLHFLCIQHAACQMHKIEGQNSFSLYQFSPHLFLPGRWSHISPKWIAATFGCLEIMLMLYLKPYPEILFYWWMMTYIWICCRKRVRRSSTRHCSHSTASHHIWMVEKDAAVSFWWTIVPQWKTSSNDMNKIASL